MTISFAYLANRVDGMGQQRVWRMLELSALKGMSAARDGSGGKVGDAASGEEPLLRPSIGAAGVIFLVAHTLKRHPQNPAASLAVNTVLLNGQAYECVSENRGKAFRGVSITPTTINVAALAAQITPRAVSSPTGGGAQTAFTPSQVSSQGGLNGDPNYNYQDSASASASGGGGANYNNQGGANTGGDYNYQGGIATSGGGTSGARGMARIMRGQIGDFQRRMGQAFGRN